MGTIDAIGQQNALILLFFQGEGCWGWRQFDLTGSREYGGVIYQTDQKDLVDVIEHLMGVSYVVN
jgi:hypothetical protein